VKEVSVPSGDRNKPDEKILTVDYVKIVPILVKAVQELQAEVAALRSQVGR
jgi:hypothetical protein